MHNKAIEMAKWAMNDACAKGYDCMTSQDWDDFKDCMETAKNAIECDYYYRIVEAMKKEEEREKEGHSPMRMYYPVKGSRTGGGNSGGMIGQGGMWEPEMDYDRETMDRSRRGSGNSGMWEDTIRRSGRETGKTRYGFSFDEYMEARDMYQANDPDQKRMRMESLNRDLDDLVEMGKEVVQDMTPEEKQVWKSKISKILNI